MQDLYSYREQVNQRLKKKYIKNKLYSINKLGGRCKQCGTEENLTFDHIIPDTKTKNIPELLRGNKKKLDEELAKCQLLCRPCHLEKTYQDQEYKKLNSPKHGSASTYCNYRCRCSLCTEAWREKTRLYRKKRGKMQVANEKSAIHGIRVSLAG